MTRFLLLLLMACSAPVFAGDCAIEILGADMPMCDGAVQVQRPKGGPAEPTYKFYRFNFTAQNSTYIVLLSMRLYDADGKQFSPTNRADVSGFAAKDNPEAPLQPGGMTSNSDSGYVTTSNRQRLTNNPVYDLYLAYGFGTWAPDPPLPVWHKIELPAAKSISRYSLATTNAGGFGVFYPKSWTFEGSNTGDFSGEQTVLHTVTNYDFPNPGNATETVITWEVPNGEAVRLW